MIRLTQEEADTLLGMEKRRLSDKVFSFPLHGQKSALPLQSIDGLESFLLDLSRGRDNEIRVKMQTRARKEIPLARLDIGGRPHRNDDGTVVLSPHLHLYKEGFHDRWAMSPPSDWFTNLEDIPVTLRDFMRFCNIVEPPKIWLQGGLI